VYQGLVRFLFDEVPCRLVDVFILVFWRNVVPPSSGVKGKPNQQQISTKGLTIWPLRCRQYVAQKCW
jgi:hypothetical protein